MIETHPFGIYVPTRAKYLILGSFTGRQSYDWFYGTERNQFWPILREVYQRELVDKSDKERLFEELGIAIGDIIYQCERKFGSNLDMNLTNIVYNTEMVGKTLKNKNIKRIYFTSRFVEAKFKRNFKEVMKDRPEVELVVLPSPSPRFAAMSRGEKVKRYKELLPKGM